MLNTSDEIEKRIEDIQVKQKEFFEIENAKFPGFSIILAIMLIVGVFISAIMTFFLGHKIKTDTKTNESLSKDLLDKNKQMEKKNKEYEAVAKELEQHNTELQLKTAEFERLNKVMEGRELKLVELQKEIETYKNK